MSAVRRPPASRRSDGHGRQIAAQAARGSIVKLAFLLLIAANLAVFGWQRGAFGVLPESGREPERVARQIEPERVRVLTPEQVKELRDRAAERAAAAAAASTSEAAVDVAFDPASGASCVEFGDFSEAQATRIRPRLEALVPAERLQARSVEAPGWFMVYVPPFKTRAEADRAAALMRDQGVKELVVIGDNSPMRFGIALGSFRDQELANRHLADLQRRGVKSARVADKPSTVPGTRFVIRDLDPFLIAALQALQKETAPARLLACGPG
jgi:hypothetical protein